MPIAIVPAVLLHDAFAVREPDAGAGVVLGAGEASVDTQNRPMIDS